jgi:hypothetical protein
MKRAETTSTHQQHCLRRHASSLKKEVSMISGIFFAVVTWYFDMLDTAFEKVAHFIKTKKENRQSGVAH